MVNCCYKAGLFYNLHPNSCNQSDQTESYLLPLKWDEFKTLRVTEGLFSADPTIGFA